MSDRREVVGRGSMTKVTTALALTVALVAAAAIALSAFLNYGAVRVSYKESLAQRFTIVTERVGEIIEKALSLGLPMAGQDTLAALLPREQADDPLVISLDVVNDRGQVLFSSDSSRVGKLVPVDEPSVPHYRRDIATDFGVGAGAVILRASGKAIDGGLEQVAGELRQTALLASLAAMLLAFWGVPWLIRGLNRSVIPVDPAPGDERPALPPELAAELDEIERQQARIAQRPGLALSAEG